MGGSARRSRFRVAVGVLAALMITVPATTGSTAGNVDGTYHIVWVSQNNCPNEQQAPLLPTVIEVEQLPLNEIRFGVGDRDIHGSISADLNFDLESEVDSLTGHFTLLSDGGATISGTYVLLCFRGGTLQGSFRGTREAQAGESTESPTPPPAPTTILPGLGAAADWWGEACPEPIPRLGTCRHALEISQDWSVALSASVSTLNPFPAGEYRAALEELGGSVLEAVQVGSLLDANEGGRPCLPVLNALLPVFARLLSQGIRGARTGRLDDLRDAAARADLLLLHAMNADEQERGPCLE